MTTATIRRMAGNEMRRAEKLLARFRADIAKEPLHALRWSADAYAAAARLSLWTEIDQWAESGLSVAQIGAELDEELRRKASFPTASSNAAANMADHACVAACANAASEIAAMRRNA